MSPGTRATTSHAELRRLADEQAALRRLATLAASNAVPDELCSRVALEVAQLLGTEMVTIDRYGHDDTTTVLASLNDPTFPVGSRWPIEAGTLAQQVLATARPARIDDYTTLGGVVASTVLDGGATSTVGVPITVGGGVWGVICVGTSSPTPLPAETEERLAGFTEIVASAIESTETRAGLRRLAEEQAALRRVATLVAEGVGTDALFAAVAEELSNVLEIPSLTIGRYVRDASVVVASLNDPGFPVGSVWSHDAPSIGKIVFETGRPARIDDYSELAGKVAERNREFGIGSTAGAPIVVDGALWGVICVARSDGDVLPADTEDRLVTFTELLATAISNSQARDLVRGLAEEQAALRRVATFVAQGGSTDELFELVADEVAHVVGVPAVTIDRLDEDQMTTVVASLGDNGWPLGTRWPVDPPSVTATILETGKPARIDDYSDLPGPLAEAVRAAGLVSSGVGAPITVDGRIWGLVTAGTKGPNPPAPESERRLGAFTELVATAISNSQTRDELHRLAEEQAALRRVATLVALGTDASAVFDAVCAETGRLLGASTISLVHETPEGAGLLLAGWSDDGTVISAGTLPSVVHGGPGSASGAPVIVDGRPWGLLTGSDHGGPLPFGSELRLARFAELIATAISNATTRAELVASRARIVAAGDEVRRRIERNLHDSVQQRLIALGFELQTLRSIVPEGLRETRADLDLLGEQLGTMLEEIRELSRGLHPALLSRGGLAPSLRALTRRMPIPVRLDVQADPRPSEAVEIGVYHVVSEALANAAQHSGASEVSVTVGIADSTVHVLVVDDGVGGAVPNGGGGTGLMRMIDRVEALGGRLVLRSPQGSGTTVSVELPDS